MEDNIFPINPSDEAERDLATNRIVIEQYVKALGESMVRESKQRAKLVSAEKEIQTLRKQLAQWESVHSLRNE